MSAARMEPEEVASSRSQTIIKQKQVTEQLKERAEEDYDGSQIFLPEESSWRTQTIKSPSGG